MKKRLKKYLVPHKDNDHQPFILRKNATKFLIGLSIALELFALVLLLPVLPAKLDFLASVLPGVLVAKTNEARLENNEDELTENKLLVLAAQLKANDMADKGYFSHVSPDGTTPWYWLGKSGYNYENAGENLAVNFVDSEDVHKAWMNSPTHRANILRNEYEEIGIATAKGQYKGKEAIFVVQYFGIPKDTIVETPQRNPLVNNVAAATEVEKATNTKAEESFEFSNNTATNSPDVATNSVAIINNTDINNNVISPSTTAVLGAEVESLSKASVSTNKFSMSILKKALSSPRTIVNTAMFLLAGLIAVALILKVFVKIKIQYPRLILNGAVVMFILAVMIFANQYLVQLITEIA